MPDVNRLALSIHLHRSPVEIVKSEQIVFGNLDHRPKKRLLTIKSEKKIVANNAPNLPEIIIKESVNQFFSRRIYL